MILATPREDPRVRPQQGEYDLRHDFFHPRNRLEAATASIQGTPRLATVRGLTRGRG